MKRLIALLLIIILTFSTIGEVFASVPIDEAVTGEPTEPVIHTLDSPVLNSAIITKGLCLTWTQVKNADGYNIYYQYNDNGTWKKYATRNGSTTLKSNFNIVKKYGKYDIYIEAFNADGETGISNTISVQWLKPAVISSTIRQKNSLSVYWNSVEKAEGYEVECNSNRFFTEPSLIKVPAPSTEAVFSDLSSSEQYYARIRAYYTSPEGSVIYSPWSFSENTTVPVNATIKRLSYNGKILELCAGAKQKIGGYDTLQGGCCTTNFGYFVLYNRNKEKCKIAKFNLKTGKCTKVSSVLPIAHGNDLTYNPHKNILVAVHSTENGKKVSIIDPISLKIKSTKIINISDALPGMSESRRTSFKGIGAIAYNEEHQQYVARIKSLNDLLFLDSNLNPVKYVRLTKEDKQIFQGMDTSGDYVLVGQSFKKSSDWNLISIYDWDGNYVSKINVKKGYELECIFHSGDDFYAGFYTSYYKTYYVTALKTVKVKNKYGKYVRKTVKYKKKKKKLMRVNYIYKMNKI